MTNLRTARLIPRAVGAMQTESSTLYAFSLEVQIGVVVNLHRSERDDIHAGGNFLDGRIERKDLGGLLALRDLEVAGVSHGNPSVAKVRVVRPHAE